VNERIPDTEVVKASDARQRFSQLVNEVFRGEKRVLIEKSGIPVAAIISAEDLKRFELLEQQRRERFRALEETAATFADVPPDELEREVERAVQEVRARRRAAVG
jgi:prevent-host-death family protein